MLLTSTSRAIQTLRAVTAAPTPPGEVAGTLDGPELVLPSGIRIQRQRIGDAVVSAQALRDAVRGILQLPMSHQRLLAALDVPVELVPVANFEQVPGTTMPVVGATRVSGPDGSTKVERLRIAANQSVHGTEVEECVQHEIGHVIGVAARQDLSEDFAERVAARY
jgi:hypothetical protein